MQRLLIADGDLRDGEGIADSDHHRPVVAEARCHPTEELTRQLLDPAHPQGRVFRGDDEKAVVGTNKVEGVERGHRCPHLLECGPQGYTHGVRDRSGLAVELRHDPDRGVARHDQVLLDQLIRGMAADRFLIR